ncbi:uncharacterized protein HKW66_Vig0056640 [Vigna angularis]|uniref:Uncharacterized protein n=1 Tax=Phaseolus angularis TaxID=3914 RepID=A0A8T0L657_PHAAN|nr:uncharacterized protein HKW66_Vig0056640 [Vigna angularis]
MEEKENFSPPPSPQAPPLHRLQWPLHGSQRLTRLLSQAPVTSIGSSCWNPRSFGSWQARGSSPSCQTLVFIQQSNGSDSSLQSQSTEHSAAVGRVSSSGAAAAVAPDAVSSGHGNTAPHAASVTLCAAAAVHAFPSSSVHAFPSSSVRAAAHVPHQQHQNGSSGQQDFLYQD